MKISLVGFYSAQILINLLKNNYNLINKNLREMFYFQYFYYNMYMFNIFFRFI